MPPIASHSLPPLYTLLRMTHEPSRHPLASWQDIKASVGITAHLWYSLASRHHGRFMYQHHGITPSPYHSPLNLLIGPYHERSQPPKLSTSSTSSTYYIYIYIYTYIHTYIHTYIYTARGRHGGVLGLAVCREVDQRATRVRMRRLLKQGLAGGQAQKEAVN